MRPWTALPVAALLALGTAGCDSSSPTAPNPVAIEQNLTETLETASFVYHYSPGDAVDPDRQQAFHAWAVAELRVTPPRIDYFKYRNRDQMARLTGRSANGWADPDAFAVHSVFTWHSHETVHLYTALIGRPSDFFNEGIAVGGFGVVDHVRARTPMASTSWRTLKASSFLPGSCP